MFFVYWGQTYNSHAPTLTHTRTHTTYSNNFPYTIQYNTVQCSDSTVQCSTVQYTTSQHTTRHNSYHQMTPHHTISHHTIPHHAISHHTTPHHNTHVAIDPIFSDSNIYFGYSHSMVKTVRFGILFLFSQSEDFYFNFFFIIDFFLYRVIALKLSFTRGNFIFRSVMSMINSSSQWWLICMTPGKWKNGEMKTICAWWWMWENDSRRGTEDI